MAFVGRFVLFRSVHYRRFHCLAKVNFTANISSRKNFMVFEVHRSSSKFLSLNVAAAPSLPSHTASANFLNAN